MACLVGIAGPVAGRHFTLEDHEYTLGRGSSATIRLTDPGVSRRHARLVKVTGSHEVEDLESFNGTYVNGSRVQRERLKDGDEVRICHDVFRYDADEVTNTNLNLAFEQDSSSESVVGRIDAAAMSQLWSTADLPVADAEAMGRKLRAVAAVSEVICSTLDRDELFNRVLDLVLDSFPQADSASVLLRNHEDDNLELHALRSREPVQSEDSGFSVSHTVIHQVVSAGQAVVAQPAVDGHPAGIMPAPTRCRMGAPIIFQQKIEGVVYVAAARTRSAFSETDLDLLTSIALQMAVALQVAEFHRQQLRQQQLEQDLQFARRVQQGFLPARVPASKNFVFASHYEPAFHVGGDFYDFVELDANRVAIVVGDVSGHGVSAALFMARLSSHIRSFAITEQQPARVLERVQAMLEEDQDGMFATILYLLLDLQTGDVLLSNAGHLPPLIRNAREGSGRSMDEMRGVVLGVLPDEPIEEHSFRLQRGDTLCLYSDGVVECPNDQGHEYGLAQLLRVFGQGGARAPQVMRRIVRDFDRHIGRQEHPDDVTLVAFSFQRL
jgi:serine phosphatase RsbU (regulator of sigma subunit)